jgi:hypothetical protein
LENEIKNDNITIYTLAKEVQSVYSKNKKNCWKTFNTKLNGKVCLGSAIDKMTISFQLIYRFKIIVFFAEVDNQKAYPKIYMAMQEIQNRPNNLLEKKRLGRFTFLIS